MRYLLHRFVIEGTVFKRYQSDHKKCVLANEMGTKRAVSVNHQIIVCVITVFFFFSNFSPLLSRRYPDNPTI